MTEKASWKEGSALVRNEKLIDTLLDSIASGMYVNLACQSVGIDTSTLYQWKKKGQQGIHPYDKVWKRLQIAEAKAIERRLNPDSFLSSTSGSAVITVNEPSHERTTGDTVRFKKA